MLKFISILVHLIIHNFAAFTNGILLFLHIQNAPMCCWFLTLSQNRRHQTVLPAPHSSTASIAVNADSPYPPKSIKPRLRKGDALYGIFIYTFSPTIAEIAGLAGYDFVVVDMEHGNGGISDVLPCLHALAATNTPAIVRIPECSSTWTKKVLDLGPQGIMFPNIDGPTAARKAVSYCRFPPNGIRGTANSFVRASEYGMDEGYHTKFEDDTFWMISFVHAVLGRPKP